MISKLEKYVTKSGYSMRVFSPQTLREANVSTFSFKLLCEGAERVVNEFGRSPTKSYSDLLGGMRSVCFGSGPLNFFLTFSIVLVYRFWLFEIICTRSLVHT